MFFRRRAQRRLAERGYTRDSIPTIDGDGPHVHIHTYDQEADDECAELADRVDYLERAVANLISGEGEEGLPDEAELPAQDALPPVAAERAQLPDISDINKRNGEFW